MKKYSVILADPPWAFRAWSNKGMGRSAEQHYSTMRLEDIKALPVADLAAEDCVLFLWATFPMLKEALEVAEAWGFAYKTVAFTWVKENRKSPGLFWGLGYWTRANAEICWRPGAVPNGSPPLSIRSFSPRWNSTAKSRMPFGSAL